MFAEIVKHGICFLPTLFRHDAQSYLYTQIKYASDTPWTVFHMGQVTKLQLSCYLVLLSIDSKTR